MTSVYTHVTTITIKIHNIRNFPGGPVIKNPPCNPGDKGSVPGQGTKILHAAEQPSPGATATELACATTEARNCNLCSAAREATATRSQSTAMKGSPHSPQPEKAPSQQWRRGTAKNESVRQVNGRAEILS